MYFSKIMYGKRSHLWHFNYRLLSIMICSKNWLAKFVIIIWAKCIILKKGIKMPVLRFSWSSGEENKNSTLIETLLHLQYFPNYHLFYNQFLHILQCIGLLIYQIPEKIALWIYFLNFHAFFEYVCLTNNFFCYK